jgi:hypothetical protein
MEKPSFKRREMYERIKKGNSVESRLLQWIPLWISSLWLEPSLEGIEHLSKEKKEEKERNVKK